MASDDLQYSAAAERLFAGDNSPMENPLFNIGTELLTEFQQYQTDRVAQEQKWLSDLRQYKGVYEPEVEAGMKGSKSFLRKTRVKVESVDARLMDLLFPANRKRNYAVGPTPDPSVPDAVLTQIAMKLQQAFQKEPTERELKQAVRKFVAEAAEKMENRVDDQLTEGRYRDVARKTIHSGNLYGTGITKGPLVERRTRLSYVYDANAGKYVQKHEAFAAPMIGNTPIWRWYPDMSVTELKDCRAAWEHHRLGRADLVGLTNRKTFDGAAIKNYIDVYPEGCIKLMNYEQQIRIMSGQSSLNSSSKTGQYDVYERWGWIDGDRLSACGIDVPQERRHETFFSNIWMFPDGRVIKAVLAPIEGVEWPWHLYYFDKDETCIFGEGIASIMRDDQDMINAVVRMILNNAAVTSGPQFEVFVPAFPAQANLTDIYPGKVWPRVGGDFQYPAVRELRFDSHIAELSQILQLFDQNADETLAIPKFTYAGENPQNGAAATMGGLSMLMGQANISLKDLVVNYDEGVTIPFINAMYHWNMKFSQDDSIKGDFECKATGASSLIAKEVRAQNLSMFVSTLQPEQRGRIKWDKLTEQQVEVLDLSDIVMDEDEFKAMQESPAMQMQNQLAQMQQQLQMALMQGQAAEIQAKAAKAEAEAAKAQAEAMHKRVEAAYSAMQAAGVAAQNPTIAPAGDAILRSAGWQDQDQQPGSGAEMAQGQPSPDMDQQIDNGQMNPPSPNAGVAQGIETEEID